MRGLRLRFAALAGLLLTVGIVSQAIGETPAANPVANKVDSELDRYRGNDLPALVVPGAQLAN